MQELVLGLVKHPKVMLRELRDGDKNWGDVCIYGLLKPGDLGMIAKLFSALDLILSQDCERKIPTLLP